MARTGKKKAKRSASLAVKRKTLTQISAENNHQVCTGSNVGCSYVSRSCLQDHCPAANHGPTASNCNSFKWLPEAVTVYNNLVIESLAV